MKTFKIFLFIIPDMVKIKNTDNFGITQKRLLDVIMVENYIALVVTFGAE